MYNAIKVDGQKLICQLSGEDRDDAWENNLGAFKRLRCFSEDRIKLTLAHQMGLVSDNIANQV